MHVMPWQPPDFAREAWYADPRDDRCPRDAWLEEIEGEAPEKDSPGTGRSHSIKLTLRGARADSWIVLTYFGVRTHSVPSYCCDQGMGRWLRDEFSSSDSGLILHRIAWQSATGAITQWFIEAQRINFESQARSAPPARRNPARSP